MYPSPSLKGNPEIDGAGALARAQEGGVRFAVARGREREDSGETLG